MCGPEGFAVGQAIVNAATSITSNVISYKQEEANNEYRNQIAINNIKNAQNEAKLIKQTGIEEARQERIKGLQELSRQKAQNASSGFDINSNSYQQNYEDILDGYNSNAQNIENAYDRKAQSVNNSQNTIASEAIYSQNQYNLNQYKNAINSLGNYTQVASNWLKKGE